MCLRKPPNKIPFFIFFRGSRERTLGAGFEVVWASLHWVWRDLVLEERLFEGQEMFRHIYITPIFYQ